MNEKEIMQEWKRDSIRIGSPTNILAALTAFIPVIWLCTVYDCWPPVSTVLTAWWRHPLRPCISWSRFPIMRPSALQVHT